MNKMGRRTYISVIILNVNGLNAPTKRHKLSERIPKKKNPYMHICAVYKKPTLDLGTHTD